MSSKKPSGREVRSVLKYAKGASLSTVKRQYAQWRKHHELPDRCDDPRCQFHTAPLIWNGKPLRLIVDHANGVRADNRPENLRYLCPNCNGQLPTHGGKNKGRVSMSDGGYSIKRDDGKRDYTMPAEPGEYRISGGTVEM
jgi:HNH endonuclease